MTPLASREMTEQEMINTSTAPQMAHLIQILRQTIRNKDKEIQKWVDMVNQLQRNDELDPPEPKPEPLPMASTHDGLGNKFMRDCLKPNEHPIIAGYNRLDYVPVEGIRVPEPEPKKGENMSNHNKETEARCIHCFRHYVEGTAAWALYMMRMGRKVTNPKYDPRVYHLPEGGMIHVNGIKSIATNQWIDYWCIDIPCGWEIYEEPKPEPKPLLADAKVGDWVEIRHAMRTKQAKILILDDAHGTVRVMNMDGSEQWNYKADITRKLSPSEVRVKVTLEGTVSQDSILDKASCFSLHTGRSEHIISLSELVDSELVESLLRAQEEEK